MEKSKSKNDVGQAGKPDRAADTKGDLGVEGLRQLL